MSFDSSVTKRLPPQLMRRELSEQVMGSFKFASSLNVHSLLTVPSLVRQVSFTWRVELKMNIKLGVGIKVMLTSFEISQERPTICILSPNSSVVEDMSEFGEKTD